VRDFVRKILRSVQEIQEFESFKFFDFGRQWVILFIDATAVRQVGSFIARHQIFLLLLLQDTVGLEYDDLQT
jgi:hypothetical protein